MLRKESEDVPEGNGPVPQQFGSGQPTWEELRRIVKERWDRQVEEMIRLVEQQLASQEQDARQPRLAMEADGPANVKTRERTEGTVKAVQAMHGDSFSARRVEPGPKTNSTSFGMMAEPPNLLCREDVLVENGDASPNSCLPSLEMRTTTVAGGLLPTGDTFTATRITFNQPWLHLFGSTRPRRRIQRRQIYGLQLHPPGTTTAVSGEINYLLPRLAGRSLRQNPGKIGRSIQVVLKVVSTPVRFWARGACCFVVRLCVLEWRDEAAAFYGGSMIRDSQAFRRAVRAKLFTPYV